MLLKKKSPWFVAGVIAALLMVIPLCIITIVLIVQVPKFLGQEPGTSGPSNIFKNTVDDAQNLQAKTMLMNVANSAEMYAAENGSYEDMDADALADYLPDNMQVIDGSPSGGEVGISSVTDSSYVLVYMNQNKKTFRATVENGEIEYDFEIDMEE